MEGQKKKKQPQKSNYGKLMKQRVQFVLALWVTAAWGIMEVMSWEKWANVNHGRVLLFTEKTYKIAVNANYTQSKNRWEAASWSATEWFCSTVGPALFTSPPLSGPMGINLFWSLALTGAAATHCITLFPSWMWCVHLGGRKSINNIIHNFHSLSRIGKKMEQ